MQSPNLPYLLLKEQIEKQNRNDNFLHYDQFRTNLNQVPITTKFWSKYDSNIRMNVNKHQHFLQKIDRSFKETPKTKYSEPQVESHKLVFKLIVKVFLFKKTSNLFRIGWNTEPMLKLDPQDIELLHHPRVSGDITRAGEKIYAEKVTQRPKYSGYPFKLS